MDANMDTNNHNGDNNNNNNKNKADGDVDQPEDDFLNGSSTKKPAMGDSVVLVGGGGTWSYNFMKLTIFQSQFGHVNPSTTGATTEEERQLALWVDDQRQKFRLGGTKSNNPSILQVQMLRSVGCTGFEEDNKQDIDGGENENRAKIYRKETTNQQEASTNTPGPTKKRARTEESKKDTVPTDSEVFIQTRSTVKTTILNSSDKDSDTAAQHHHDPTKGASTLGAFKRKRGFIGDTNTNNNTDTEPKAGIPAVTAATAEDTNLRNTGTEISEQRRSDVIRRVKLLLGLRISDTTASAQTETSFVEKKNVQNMPALLPICGGSTISTTKVHPIKRSEPPHQMPKSPRPSCGQQEDNTSATFAHNNNNNNNNNNEPQKVTAKKHRQVEALFSEIQTNLNHNIDGTKETTDMEQPMDREPVAESGNHKEMSPIAKKPEEGTSKVNSPAITGTQKMHQGSAVSTGNPTLIIRPNDVLCGRGTTSFNHSGNKHFRHIISQSIENYRAATSRFGKSLVVERLVSVIHSSGGRFLKQKNENEGEWYELSTSESRTKVVHAMWGAIKSKSSITGKVKENTGRWQAEEHEVFLKGLNEHGKKWTKIAMMIKTRSVLQVCNYGQKYFQKLLKNKKMERPQMAPDSLRLSCGKPLSWGVRFEQLKEFQKRVGHLQPRHPRKSDGDGNYDDVDKGLYLWLASQRSYYRKGNKRLSLQQVQLLRRIGTPGFEEDLAHEKYRTTNSASTTETDAKEENVYDDDDDHDEEDGGQLEQELEELKKKRTKGVSWWVRFEQLKEFQKRVGHLQPRRPRKSDGDNDNDDVDEGLYFWLARQRHHYRNGGSLSLHQIQLLRQIGTPGFEEDLAHEKYRTTASASITKTDAEEESDGDDDDDDHEEEDGGQLEQEQEEPKKKRTKGVSWWVRFEQLKEFQKLVGHLKPLRLCDVDGDFGAVDEALYIWLAKQRSYYRRGNKTLSLQQVQLLRQIGTPGFEEDLAHEKYRTTTSAAAATKTDAEEENDDDDGDKDCASTPSTDATADANSENTTLVEEKTGQNSDPSQLPSRSSVGTVTIRAAAKTFQESCKKYPEAADNPAVATVAPAFPPGTGTGPVGDDNPTPQAVTTAPSAYFPSAASYAIAKKPEAGTSKVNNAAVTGTGTRPVDNDCPMPQAVTTAPSADSLSAPDPDGTATTAAATAPVPTITTATTNSFSAVNKQEALEGRRRSRDISYSTGTTTITKEQQTGPRTVVEDPIIAAVAVKQESTSPVGLELKDHPDVGVVIESIDPTSIFKSSSLLVGMKIIYIDRTDCRSCNAEAAASILKECTGRVTIWATAGTLQEDFKRQHILHAKPVSWRERTFGAKKVSWWVRFEQLKEFQKLVGHLKPLRLCDVDGDFGAVDEALYIWLAKQRSYYRRGNKTLSLQQVQLLRQIGTPGFEEDLAHERYRTTTTSASIANTEAEEENDADDDAKDCTSTSSTDATANANTENTTFIEEKTGQNKNLSQLPSRSSATSAKQTWPSSGSETPQMPPDSARLSCGQEEEDALPTVFAPSNKNQTVAVGGDKVEAVEHQKHHKIDSTAETTEKESPTLVDRTAIIGPGTGLGTVNDDNPMAQAVTTAPSADSLSAHDGAPQGQDRDPTTKVMAVAVKPTPTSGLGLHLKVHPKTGVVIKNIHSTSIFKTSGLRAGMKIISINDVDCRSCSSSAEVASIIKDSAGTVTIRAASDTFQESCKKYQEDAIDPAVATVAMAGAPATPAFSPGTGTEPVDNDNPIPQAVATAPSDDSPSAASDFPQDADMHRNTHRGSAAPTGKPTLIIHPNDVLCGCGETSFNHSGNWRFTHIISQLIGEYGAATSSLEMSLLSARLVSVIHNSGGRFLEQKKENEDEWHELSTSESRTKAANAMRDAIAFMERKKGARTITENPVVGAVAVNPGRSEASLRNQPQMPLKRVSMGNEQATLNPAAMMNFGAAAHGRRVPNPMMMHGKMHRGSAASTGKPTLIIRPNDVLCGRGKTSLNHPGNKRFRHIISQSIEDYRAGGRLEKSLVVQRLVSVIHRSGGRFLKQKFENEDEWCELSTLASRTKAGHAIRDAVANMKRKAGTRTVTENPVVGAVAVKQPPTTLVGLELKDHPDAGVVMKNMDPESTFKKSGSNTKNSKN